MKRRLASFLVLSLLTASTYSQDKGTFSFLRNDIGARAAGLNGSFVSMTDDPNVLFYNPGALTSLTESKGSAGFLKHLLDVNGGYLSYSRSLEGISTAGSRTPEEIASDEDFWAWVQESYTWITALSRRPMSR